MCTTAAEERKGGDSSSKGVRVMWWSRVWKQKEWNDQGKEDDGWRDGKERK